MIQLFTLGTTDLRGEDGTSVHSFLSGSKRLAFFAYLALARPRGFHRRDTILGLFWPESTQKRARGSLRGLLHQVRRALGDDVIANRGDEEIGVSEGALWCDAIQFEAALDEGRLRGALELYRGDLLEGLFVPDAAPAFEHWLDGERTRLRRRAAEAAWALAEEEEALGNPSGAAYWARRAISITPLDEAAVRQLMELLDRVGNRAGALQAHEDLAHRLRKEFEVEPSRETQALAAALRERSGAVDPDVSVPASGTGESTPIGAELGTPEAEPAEAPQHAVGGSSARGARFLPWSWPRVVLPALLALLAVAAVYLPFALERPETEPLGHNVAILPFRVAGADSSLGYLREGMVDLLAARLAGEDANSAVDPRTTLIALRRFAGGDRNLPRDSAVLLARKLQAGRVLLGEVVGTPAHVVLSASVLSVPDGKVHARTAIEGPADSLPVLADRLAARLLSLEAGETERRLPALTSTSFPALQAYLRGRAAFRRAEYEEAILEYSTALDLDSTFALAGIGLAKASGWSAGAGDRARGLRLAWRTRERLAPVDRAYLAALAGPRYPDRSSHAEVLEQLMRVVEASPGHFEVWYSLGDHLFHHGALLGIRDWRSRSIEYMGRALALDSTSAPIASHLLHLALAEGDIRRAERFGTSYFAKAPEEESEYLRWFWARVRGDSAELSRIRGRLDEMSAPTLIWVEGTAVFDGVGLDDADRAVETLKRRVHSPGFEETVLREVYFFDLNRGRPGAAARTAQRLGAVAKDPHLHLRLQVLAAVYGSGDTAAGAQAARILSQRIAAGAEAEPGTRPPQQSDRCVQEQWRLWQGETAGSREAIERLRGQSPGQRREGDTEEESSANCALLLEAILATVQRHPDAARLTALADSMMRTGPVLVPEVAAAANLAVARLHEAQGNRPLALAATRRRGYLENHSSFLLSDHLREEGRLAGLAGDRAGAIRAYRHYLALRSAPEPALKSEAAKVRETVRRLTRPAK